MKWATSVRHLELAAEACSRMAELPPSLVGLRVVQLWAVGEVLGPPQDLEWITVALSVDLPVAEVPWWTVPLGGDAWVQTTRLSKYPVLTWWRSAQAPVWNHRIVRPVLVWDEAHGVDDAGISAVREGRGASRGVAEPTMEDFVSRMEDELAVSLAELQRRTEEYDTHPTTRLGTRADALSAAARGYLDVLAAQPPAGGRAGG